MKKFACGLLLSLCLLYTGSALCEARAYAVIEETTGRVLYAHNARTPLPMASTTKVMTALLALELGELTDVVTVSRSAYGVPGTSMYLGLGEQRTLSELLTGLMVASANDAAVAIAEYVAGDVDNFAKLMTARAGELGCESATFLNPHGLPANGHQASALDMARIARAAMRLPKFRELVGTKRATVPWEGRTYDRILYNKNALLSSYPGATGVKTGYTRAAGRCLVFSAERDGLSLIGAVLSCPDWFSQAAALLDRGFAEYRMAVVLHAGEKLRDVAVIGGAVDAVAVCAGKTLQAPVPKDAWPEVVVTLPEALEAGVEIGEEVGEISLVYAGETLATVPLVAARSAPVRDFGFGLDAAMEQYLLMK